MVPLFKFNFFAVYFSKLICTGTWENDKQNGNGKMDFANGDKFTGF